MSFGQSNISNRLALKTITLNERYNNEKVPVFISNGNNKYLLIGLLRRRFWLEVANKVTKSTKFKWTQIRSKRPMPSSRIAGLSKIMINKT